MGLILFFATVAFLVTFPIVLTYQLVYRFSFKRLTESKAKHFLYSPGGKIVITMGLTIVTVVIEVLTVMIFYPM
jgi:hypothetical protein